MKTIIVKWNFGRGGKTEQEQHWGGGEGPTNGILRWWECIQIPFHFMNLSEMFGAFEIWNIYFPFSARLLKLLIIDRIACSRFLFLIETWQLN